MNFQTAPTIERTTYDRDATAIGIVHLGYGAFHRAHQAVYVDQYMEETGDLAWGIAAVNLRGSEAENFRAAQDAKDGYLLKTTSPEDDVQYQLVRAHVRFEDWSQDQQQAEALLSLESVHAVTITVTEAGYCLDDNWALNVDDPALRAELEGGAPQTVYAYLANALAKRAEAGGKPISVLCCDNIRSNGKMLCKNFTAYLRLRGLTDLENWISENATFPCSMVDRITPRTTDALLAEIDAAFAGRTLAPIHGERFIQWVIQENFAGPMPDLAKCGVEVVEDVDPYEEAKIRILNGGHTGLCYLGALAGHQTFDQAMRDPKLRAHFDNWEQKNVLPGLKIELPFDRAEYLGLIAARFSNRAIADDLARICMDGWSKMPIFVRPTLEGCLSEGIDPVYGYDVIASWYVYARRHQAGANDIPYVDAYWDALEPLLEKGREEEFAQSQSLWGTLPVTYDNFAPGIVAAIKKMEEQWPK